MKWCLTLWLYLHSSPVNWFKHHLLQIMSKSFLYPIVILFLCIEIVPGKKNEFYIHFHFKECIQGSSNVYSDKRGRPQYSSLIPFPRVGRSSGPGIVNWVYSMIVHWDMLGDHSKMWYYGQKRGGKSGLIPFPRVGRSGPNTWQLDEESDSTGKSWKFIKM